MKRFLYFLAGVSRFPDKEQLKAAGLSHLAGMPFSVKAIPAGPGGGAGVMLARQAGPEFGGVSPAVDALAFDPEKQDSFRMFGDGGELPGWLALSKDRAQWPGPGDLSRNAITPEGEFVPVRLGDGNEWLIPIVRFAKGDTALPRVVVRGANGRPRWRVAGEHLPLVHMCSAVLDIAFGLREDLCTPDFLLALGSAALAVNYHIGRNEVSALELLDTRNIQEVAHAMLDSANLEKLIEEYGGKKNGADSGLGPISETGGREFAVTAHPSVS